MKTICPIDGEYVKEARIGHAIMDADVFITLTLLKDMRWPDLVVR